jgi:hypothetical protein
VILFLGAGAIVSYALVYSGIASIQGTPVSTLQALWPKGKALPSSFPKPQNTSTGPGAPRQGRGA